MRQINLLPPQRRLDLKRKEAWEKLSDSLARGQLALWFMSFTGVVLMLALWILSLTAVTTTTAELQVEVDNYKEIRKDLAQQRALLDQVAKVAEERVVWSEVLMAVVPVVPSGVQMGVLTGTANDKGKPSLQVRGQAVTRSVLQAFEKRVQGLAVVERVESPTSNLLDRDNPAFEVKLWLNPGGGL